MDLLDYVKTPGCGLTRKSTLCELNDNPRSTPIGRLSLIGGTKPDVFGVPGLGHFLVGPMTNDGVVPLSSAQGRSTVHYARVDPGETGSRRPGGLWLEKPSLDDTALVVHDQRAGAATVQGHHLSRPKDSNMTIH